MIQKLEIFSTFTNVSVNIFILKISLEIVRHIDISFNEFSVYMSVPVIHKCQRTITIINILNLYYFLYRKKDNLSTWHFESRAPQVVTLTPCHLAEEFHISYALVTLQTHYSWMRDSLLHMRACVHAYHIIG
jgi:hypothetical protein